jgi:hypothetical protein
MRSTLLTAITLICVGCTTTHHQRVVKSATPEQKAALLERVKSLAGTWEGKAPDGTVGTTTYQVTSNGTAVREIMLVGTSHEMTNMYTMDGDELLMTHYCAMGNQPQMRASASNDNRIVFKSAGVSNLTRPDQMYMGEMTIEFIDADHIKQHWQSLKYGKPADHSMTIEKTRKQ